LVIDPRQSAGEELKDNLVKMLNSDHLHSAIHQALDEVDRRFKSGELDGSCRYYTDEELAAGGATGGKRVAAKPKRASAA
jgi:hypothetical protein